MRARCRWRRGFGSCASRVRPAGSARLRGGLPPSASSGAADLHVVAVLQIADRVERAGDHLRRRLSARTAPRSTCRRRCRPSPGMKVDSLFLNTNTPSISLRVWPGLSSAACAAAASGAAALGAWPSGRAARARSGPSGRTPVRARPSPESAPTAPVARRGRDSAEQVKPGTHFRNLLVELHRHLEVRRLLSGWRRAPSCWIGLLPISVTLPVNVWSGSASIVILADLADLHRRDVGLVDFDLRLDDRHVGERQQLRAGVVHRADDDVFAFLDVAARDDAVERRQQRHLPQVVLAGVERRRFLLDHLFARPDLRTRAPRSSVSRTFSSIPPGRASRASSAAAPRGRAGASAWSRASAGSRGRSRR